MNTYRVDVIITLDIQANNPDHAEVVALETIDFPGASVEQVKEISTEKDQPGLFDE